jgi:hypothetical protein
LGNTEHDVNNAGVEGVLDLLNLGGILNTSG